MSDLDETLLAVFTDNLPAENGLYNVKTAVSELKRAFKDAGYVRVPNVSHVDDKLYIANGMDTRDFVDATNKRLMTGQEWYDRCATEIDRLFCFDALPKGTLQRSEAWAMAIKAAKKAAGIE